MSLEGKYVLCLTEGTAETEIMTMLLDGGYLPFGWGDLVGNRIHCRMKARDVQERFLSLSYSKPVLILRLVDSRNERFVLDGQYRGRFEIVTVNTRPEIEILLIIKNGDYADFCKTKSHEKPSEYCRRKYGYTKRQGCLSSMITADELIEAIQVYSGMRDSREYTLQDLIDGR